MVIIACGIFGNILSLIVLGKKDDSSTTSKFLRSLAVADTMTLTSRCMQMLYQWGETFWPYHSQTWIMSSFAFYILSLLPDRISKGSTVAVSVDRLVAVTLPLRYKIICRPMRITVVIVMIYVIIASTCLPQIFDVFLYHIQTGENRRNYSYIGTQYIKDIVYQSKLKSVHFLLNNFLFDIVPSPVVLLCNIGIVACYRQSNMKKSTINEAQQQRKHKERKLTKLLLTISMLFLVLAGPSAMYAVLIRAGATPKDQFVSSIVLNILSTLSLLNSSINFIVYAVMNKKYREGYTTILCCICRHG